MSASQGKDYVLQGGNVAGLQDCRVAGGKQAQAEEAGRRGKVKVCPSQEFWVSSTCHEGLEGACPQTMH